MKRWKYGDKHQCPRVEMPHSATNACVDYAIQHGDLTFAGNCEQCGAQACSCPLVIPDHVPFEGGGVREAVGDRARFELLVPLDVPYEHQLLTRLAVHMAKGAEKYADRNWESFSDPAALERCKSSALRHIFQWATGTDDGEDHAAAVIFNLMAAEHVARKLILGVES